MAASISYYAFVSLIPLLVLAVTVALYVGGAPLKDRILLYASNNIPAGFNLIKGAVEAESLQGPLAIVSLGLTLWGALKIFRGVDVAFSRIYGSEPGGIVDQVRDGIVVLAAIGLGFVGIGAVTSLIAIVQIPFVNYLSPVILLLSLCLAFYPFYYVLPDVEMDFREAVPGTVFAALGWTALGTVFGIYAAAAAGNPGDAGVAAVGAILLLLTFFYFSGILLLTGAVVNAVVGGFLMDRQVQQPSARQFAHTDMSEERDAEETRREVEPSGAPDIAELEDRVEELRTQLDSFERDVDERTVKKPELERELKRYVRAKMRRGKARGWGPYLVLLYGTVMTLGAFFFEDGLTAIAAMLVIFLSTLGLYTLFVLVGVGFNVMGVPAKAVDRVRDRK